MEYVLVKTEYSWNDMIDLPGWDIWPKDKLEIAKKTVKDYFADGGSSFFVPMDKDNSMEFRYYNDVFGPWCYQVEYTISEDEYNVLVKLFTGQFGKMNLTKIYKEIVRINNQK